MNSARITPPSIGQTRSVRPKANNTAIGVSSELAAAKVAEDTALCTRFCRCGERMERSLPSEIRPISIASSAPTIDVFAVTPSVVIMCMPISAPNTLSAAVVRNTTGSNTRGCLAS